MKHVFIIHSHTTMLTAIGTVNSLKLNVSDVIFLFGRRYTTDAIDIPYKSVDANEIYDSSERAYTANSNKEKMKSIDEVDEFIKNNIQEKYTLYIPNFCIAFFCLLYTNRNCVMACYIQEGAIPFSQAYQTNYSFFDLIKYIIRNIVKNKPLRIWFPCVHYRAKTLYKQKELHSYALNNKIFANLPSINHIINWPVYNIDFEVKENGVIFIADGFVKNKMAEKNLYLEHFANLVNENAKENNYIKFHPNESNEERDYIINLFKSQSLNLIVIPDNIPMELLLLKSEHFNVVGSGSSLCFFARDLGHHVVCYDDKLYKDSELFRNYINHTGAVLFKEMYN